MAGVGQALQQAGDRLRYVPARNEQAMVHVAAGYAKMANRLQTLACTSSIGPGATNMITGAALCTINRLPVLLLPGRHLRHAPGGPRAPATRVPDRRRTFRSTTASGRSRRYWDRINRPEQLVAALLEAMRVLTSPAETGAVTLALPEDVQSEAFEYPEALFEKRVWRVAPSAPGARGRLPAPPNGFAPLGAP